MTRATRHRAPDPEALATLLGAPAPDEAPFDERGCATLATELAVVARGRGRTVRLDAFVVEHPGARTVTPFRWSARTARRSLGTRVARLVASGSATDALTAARSEIDRQCDRARCGLVRRGGLGPWLLGATPVVRTRCAMEAATWACGLLALVAPDRTGICVGVADAWFEVPAGRMTLHARRDALSPAPDGVRRGILRLGDGAPSSRATDGLLADAVIASLASPSRPPRCVVGAWPDAGVVLALPFDAAAARAGARLLVDAASILSGRGSTTHRIAA